MITVEVSTQGLIERLQARVNVLSNLAPDLEKGRQEFGRIEAEQFASGAGWKPLHPFTIEWKGDSRILWRKGSGRLEKSLVNPEVISAGPLSLTTGTTVPYAAYHQRGFTTRWGLYRGFDGVLHSTHWREPPRWIAPRPPIRMTAARRTAIANAVLASLRARLRSI